MNPTFALAGLTPGVSAGTRSLDRIRVDGKFLAAGDERFLVKGVTYGTFAPDASGCQFPPIDRVRTDFAAMRDAGINTVRVYTPPRPALLDAAAEQGLRVMVGLPWSQHTAFLDDTDQTAQARQSVVDHVRALSGHPALLMFAVGNEIPPAIVRWHGRKRVERFLADLYAASKDVAPDALFTYVNFPPTEYLELSAFDVYAFNVYLHREADLRAYLVRLHHVAGMKPLLLAEAGADSLREGDAEQARVTSMHIRAAFEEGLCGAVAFAWTDEWWRGGQDVTDWRFGLVDTERRPKPALAAVRQAFADAPFSAESRRAWPRVSVVVCAYNAADTMAECVESLKRLDYPDFEVIVVNDGSKDSTGELARNAADERFRVIDIPNGGLSAARNVGLSQATGEIVAYTDSDVRVDPDWLKHLVQPFLASDVVGSGGPNVVPADDPWVAQCVARAPGAPTHVLLDDRTAEHVPGCNMAFRRDALSAIGGFNPIYLRAGDDVDVCWRLQARGWRIGFAASALVWHRHRSSVKAYWKQQVGYGEGESWLMHQHPDKFAGGNMIWRGHIYSPLPFVRGLTRVRMNTGVWGLSPFPSVYHTGAEPWSFLPHSGPWYLAAALSLAIGAGVRAATSFRSAGYLLLLAGLLAAVVTVWRCVTFARRTDLTPLAGGGPEPRPGAWAHRAMIAWMHFLQPLARMRGQWKGWLQPPEIPAAVSAIPASATRPRPRLSAIWAAIRLLAGASAEDRYWSERWIPAHDVLRRVIEALQLARLSGAINIPDGWDQRRDLSVALGRWAWFDLCAVVEEHAGGRVLARVRAHLRPTLLSVAVGVLGFGAILLAATSLWTPRWSIPSAAVIAAGVSALALGTYRTASTLASLRGVVRHALEREGALALDADRPTIRFAPDLALWRYAGRSALASLFVVGLVLGSSLLMRDAVVTTVEHFEQIQAPEVVEQAVRELTLPRVGLAVAPNGDLYVSDADQDVIRRVGAVAGATPVGLGPPTSKTARERAAETVVGMATPGGVAVAPNGDLYIADTETHRIYRVDRIRGTTIVVAGTGRPGFAGDGGAANKAMLNQPASVAVDKSGNLYIADTANHRIRKIVRRTGVISTLAGTGAEASESGSVGDGELATGALLSWPMDLTVATTGDIYVADTGHNRVRRIDGRTGRIATVAGDGSAGGGGDGGPAVKAGLSAPTGVALVARRKQVTLYIADSSNGRVRVVTPDGIITSLALPNAMKLGAPSRVAYHPRGFLYIAGGENALAAVSLAPSRAPSRQLPAAAPPAVHQPPRRAM